MAHVSDPAERVGKSKGKLDLGVHGAALRDLYSNARPSSAQPSSTSRPSSSRRIRAGIGQAATEPRRNVQDRLSHSESPDRGEAMLQPQFDTLVEEIAGVPSQIPKLVLSGVPSARGKLSSRQMLARTAHADRMAGNTYTYMFTHLCKHICMYIYVHICLHICMYICIYATHVYIHTCNICKSAYSFVYMYIIHLYIQMYEYFTAF